MRDSSPVIGLGLGHWVTRLSQRELPVLDITVQRLCSTTSDEKASALDLATVVLQDASMTSQVLRTVNSAYYNPTGREISTISRAVILLGFDTVRTVGLSIAVISNLLKGTPQTRLVEVLRQALHAAVEAKVIATLAGDPQPEEIFIAALLYRLGEMAFWSHAEPGEIAALKRLLADMDADPRLAEQEILGCSLRQLSAGLAQEWHLGDVLQDALRIPFGARPPKSRCAHVLLGHELEGVVRQHGWDGAATTEQVRRIARHLQLAPEDEQRLIEESRQELRKAEDAFGLRVPVPGETSGTDAPASVRPAASQPALPAEAQPVLQLKILRELTTIADNQDADMQLVLHMVMEGISRGIGMDRTLLAVLTPDRKALRTKYAMGEGEPPLSAAFNIDLSHPAAALFKQVLGDRSALWTARLPAADLPRLLPPVLKQRLAGEFFAGTLAVRGKDIGLIYADRRTSGRPLEEEGFESFRHFIKQANLCLQDLLDRSAGRRPGGGRV